MRTWDSLPPRWKSCSSAEKWEREEGREKREGEREERKKEIQTREDCNLSATSRMRRGSEAEMKRTGTVADISLVPLDKLYGEVEQALEVIARVGDRPRFEPEPAHHLEDRLEVSPFFCGRVRVVVLSREGEEDEEARWRAVEVKSRWRREEKAKITETDLDISKSS